MVWFYSIGSVALISLISFIGLFGLALSRERLNKVVIYLVSLSTGTLLGDAFIHLLPEAYAGSNIRGASIFTLSGILMFFVMEKFVHWRHCHTVASDEHPHPFSTVILVGDSIHNFIDGTIIAGSYLVSIPLGIATTLAVVLHEIPQEMGNFGSLIYGGFTKIKAIALNFATDIFAVLGAMVVLLLNVKVESLTAFLIPFAAGGFVYVASADLIPELHKHTDPKKSAGQLIMFIFGIGLMFGLLFLE